MDGDIIDFEHDSNNKELLNALFRGVHTLKGNANAFGFSRLGGFVHNFEDMLDNYRSAHAVVPPNAVDVMLDGVDIIKAVMNMEINGDDGLPDKYEQCLQSIINLLNQCDDSKSSEKSVVGAELSDLSAEFISDEAANQNLENCNFEEALYV